MLSCERTPSHAYQVSSFVVFMLPDKLIGLGFRFLLQSISVHLCKHSNTADPIHATLYLLGFSYGYCESVVGFCASQHPITHLWNTFAWFVPDQCNPTKSLRHDECNRWPRGACTAFSRELYADLIRTIIFALCCRQSGPVSECSCSTLRTLYPGPRWDSPIVSRYGLQVSCFF